jgi:fructoselysine-6-P-deglycase FrlB-like protein
VLRTHRVERLENHEIERALEHVCLFGHGGSLFICHANEAAVHSHLIALYFGIWRNNKSPNGA